MLQHSVLESSRSARHTTVAPPHGHQLMAKRFWPCWVGIMALCMLSLPWTTPRVAAADPAGFARHCSGLAQDPLLRALWPGTSESGVETRATVLTAMVPRLSLRGTALATYEPRPMGQTTPTLEAVFGLVPGAQRAITETAFSQDARAVSATSQYPGNHGPCPYS
jgi:hypothetical protein